MRSLSLPFRYGGGRTITTVDPDVIVKQKVIDVLVTRRLERVARPAYGAGVYDFLFDNLTDAVMMDIKVDISRDIQFSVSGVTVVDINMTETNPGDFLINVIYRTPMSGMSQVSVPLSRPDILTEESRIL
jgi:phage baseplate assembly protein W